MTAHARTAAAVPLAAGLLLGLAGPAQASCVSATPPPSPYRFTGTVLSTAAQGRIAQVRTDDGRTVEVHGSPDSAAVTTVDRTYITGARYEFDPVNDASPYQDNLCTATRILSAAHSTTAPPAAAHQHAPAGRATLWASAATAAALLALAAAIAEARRRGRRPPVG